MEESSKLLTVICDVNLEWWRHHTTHQPPSTPNYNNDHNNHNTTSFSFQQAMDSLLVFCNSYLMMRHTNKIVFIAYDSRTCRFIYPNANDDTDSNENNCSVNDGKFDMFTQFNDTVQEKIKAMTEETANDSTLPSKSPSLLAGALSKALCYIHNNNKDITGKVQSRIFVLKCSPDGSSHYTSVMNCIFAAKKEDVLIDCCDVERNSGFLQQAASITGGSYFAVDRLPGLLQYMLWMFLPDADIRGKLNLPKSEDIDYRAVCFCHKRFVDIGFVCSVCLSIYCQFVPKCQTCQTRFKLPQLSMSLKGKKKGKKKKKDEEEKDEKEEGKKRKAVPLPTA